MGNMLSDPGNSPIAQAATMLLSRNPGLQFATMNAAKSGALDLAQKKSQLQALADLGMGTDPKTGITWDGPTQDPAKTGVPYTPPQGGDASAPGALPALPMNILRRAMPEKFAEADANRAIMAPMLKDVPDQDRTIAMLDPKAYFQRQMDIRTPAPSANMVEINQLGAQIDKLGGPQNPAAKPYVDRLASLTFNTGGETTRHNKVEEGLLQGQQNLERYSYQSDPMSGQFIKIDKITGAASYIDGRPYNGGGIGSLFTPPSGGLAPPPTNLGAPQVGPTLPPAAAPQIARPSLQDGSPGVPIDSTPVGGQKPTQAPQGTPQSSAQPGQPAPPEQYDVLSQGLPLAPEVEAKLQQLPPMMQGTLRAILIGNQAPPQGNLLKDPFWRNVVDIAHTIDPTFSEPNWRTRSTLAAELGKAEPSSMAGRIASARKLVNHSFDALTSATALNNTMLGGSVGNKIGNWADSSFGGDTNKVNAALGDYDIARKGVSGEFEKLMTGAQGSADERKDIEDAMSSNAPIAKQAAALGRVASLMEGQIQPLADQINNTMRTNYPIEHFLGARESAKLQTIKELAAQAKTGQLTPEVVRQRLSGIVGAQGQTPITPKAGTTYNWTPEKGLH